MALRSPWVPSTILRGKPFQSCKLDKPSQNPLPVCSLYLSISPLSNITFNNNNNRRTTTSTRNPLLFQISSSSTTTTAETQITDLETKPGTRLIAQNVPWDCTIDDIRNLFEKHGTVLDVELSMFNKTRNRGLAFVTMGSEEEANAALTNLQSYELEGRVLNVEISTSVKKKKKPPPVETGQTTYKAFVGNLSWKVTSADLKEFFSSLNSSVVRAEVIYQQQPDVQTEIRKSSGYGFVSFSSKEEAETVISTYKGKLLMGRPMRLGRSRRRLKEGMKQEFKKPTQVEESSTEVKTEALSETAV